MHRQSNPRPEGESASCSQRETVPARQVPFPLPFHDPSLSLSYSPEGAVLGDQPAVSSMAGEAPRHKRKCVAEACNDSSLELCPVMRVANRRGLAFVVRYVPGG